MITFLRQISKIRLRLTDEQYIHNFFKTEIDWHELQRLAEAEGVAGILYLHLKQLHRINLLPASISRHLANAYRQTTRNTLSMIAELMTIGDMLKRAFVPVIVLQGLSVVRLYGNPGLRGMGDMDLMVNPIHKKYFKDLLYHAGYRFVPSYPDVLSKDNFLIDIHTHPLNLDRIKSRRFLFPENISPMWEKAVPYFASEKWLLQLDPYDNFIALCAHASKHSYSRLIWLVDLHEFLLKYFITPETWITLLERARFWHQEKIVLYALILVENFFEFNVPMQVKRGLGIQHLNRWEKCTIRLMQTGFSSNELFLLLWLCNIRGGWNKLRFIRETVFPREEVMSQIFSRGSGSVRGSDYLKRTIWALGLFGSNLRQGFLIHNQST